MKNYLRTVLRGVSAILLGIGLASVPLTLAFADTPTATVSNQPPASITAGTPISFTVTTSGFTNPSFSLSDSFAGTSLSSSNIVSNGNFNWTPSAVDVGVHSITLHVSDIYGNNTSVTESVTITSTPSVFIQSLTPGSTVPVGSTMTFTAVPTGFQIPIAYTVSDTYGTGSTVSSSNINSSGYFSWTPTSNELGTHTITVTVTDPYGHSANVSQQVSVASGGLSVTYVNPSNTITQGVTVLITLAATGFSNPSYTVTDTFPGSSVAGASVDTTAGTLSWTPGASDVGTHTITIHATDSAGNIGTATTTITVNSATVTLPPSLLASLSAADFQEMMLILNLIGVSQSTITSLTATYNSQHVAGSTTASTGFVFTQNLAVGSLGSEVTQLQNTLAAKGYFSGTATGYYGPLTQVAVTAFQKANGIAQLGIVGPQTRAVLNQ